MLGREMRTLAQVCFVQVSKQCMMLETVTDDVKQLSMKDGDTMEEL